jgi:hypothetical protein
VGGFGSGRWYRYSTRATVEGCQRIDVRHLRKAGLLRRRLFPLSWTRGAEPSGSIMVHVTMGPSGRAESLELEYKHKSGYASEWTSMRDRIELAWTSCNYGGERPWLVCPSCRRRRAVLCLAGRAVFRCRQCHGLAYASTREDPLARTDSKLRELRRRMGENEPWRGGATDWYPLEKPKGMHWTTWERLLRERRAQSDRWHLLFVRDLAELGLRLGRIAGDRGEADRLAGELRDCEAAAVASGVLPPWRQRGSRW